MLGKYLEGLYRRFEEEYEASVSNLQKMIPDWRPVSRKRHSSEVERATEAACGIAASIGMAALLNYRGKLPGEDPKSEGELAVAVAYEQLVFVAICAHLKDEEIDLDMKPAGSFVADIPYLPKDFRSRAFQAGVTIAVEVLQKQEENVKQWRDTLFQVVGFYLLSGARRRSDLEADVQKAIIEHSHGLFNALGR